ALSIPGEVIGPFDSLCWRWVDILVVLMHNEHMNKEATPMNTSEILLDESYADPEPHRELEDLEEFESESAEIEIRESDLRDALEDAATANGVADELDIDDAIAHWRQHPTGTEGAVTPNDNDGYATRLVDQIACGYLLADGPWWK